MVVVSIEDMLCKRCGALLNHLDKLESDLDIVKRALTGYLKMKYGLLEDADEQTKHQTQNITSQTNVKGMIHTKSESFKSHFFQMLAAARFKPWLPQPWLFIHYSPASSVSNL
jgi:hypothetical protein